MVAIINEALLRAMTALSGLKARLASERGQDLLEYAILGGFIAVAAATAFTLILLTGPNVFQTMATTIKNCVDFSQTTACG